MCSTSHVLVMFGTYNLREMKGLFNYGIKFFLVPLQTLLFIIYFPNSNVPLEWALLGDYDWNDIF